MKKILIIFCLCFLIASPSYAKSVVHLKGGEQVTGDIVERTDDYVRINFEGVELTYWSDQIESLEEDGASPLVKAVVQEESVQVSPTNETALSSQKIVKDVPKGKILVSQEVAEEFVDHSSKVSAQPLIAQETSSVLSDDNKASSKMTASSEGPLIAVDKGASVIPAPFLSRKKVAAGPDASMNKPPMTPEQARAAAGAIATVGMVVGFLTYLFFAFCLQLIAAKTATPNAWLAWIPIANLYLMCKVAAKPVWWMFCFFVPFINIIFVVLLWMGIAQARNKPAWLGLLMLVPAVNFFVPIYLAFSK
ncbi:MAG: DUF5684 domain-containing protein [Candidatus Omnitrophota bacterium]